MVSGITDLNEISGLPRILEKSGKNTFVTKVREKSGNFVCGQGKHDFLEKVREKSGNFSVPILEKNQLPLPQNDCLVLEAITID